MPTGTGFCNFQPSSPTVYPQTPHRQNLEVLFIISHFFLDHVTILFVLLYEHADYYSMHCTQYDRLSERQLGFFFHIGRLETGICKFTQKDRQLRYRGVPDAGIPRISNVVYHYASLTRRHPGCHSNTHLLQEHGGQPQTQWSILLSVVILICQLRESDRHRNKLTYMCKNTQDTRSRISRNRCHKSTPFFWRRFSVPVFRTSCLLYLVPLYW